MFCSFGRDALENDICSRLKMLQCMNLFSFVNQLCNAAWFNVPQRDTLLLNINQCFATNPFVIFIFVFYQTFKNSKFSVFLPVDFIFIPLLEKHPGLTSVMILVVQGVLT